MSSHRTPHKRYRHNRPERQFNSQRRCKNIRSRISPGADGRLKRLFARIGTPRVRSFTPDPFQIEAVAAILHSDCLVTAPTGAGKTWIAVQAIDAILHAGGRAWYASPLKALSNAKYAEFCAHFGTTRTGILTGDRRENPEAVIIVGTTEILRNQLYDAMHRGEDLETDLVVLDEAHFLGDKDRGVVWEEVMIYLPPRIPLLLLSATIGNAGQIARWLNDLRGRACRVVATDQRPVPLEPIFFHPSGTLLPLLAPASHTHQRPLDKKVLAYLKRPKPMPLVSPGRLPPYGDILGILRRYHLLPAIFFLKSRADCDRALARCDINRPLLPERRWRLAQRIDELSSQSPHIARHRQRWALEQLAVGAHHSGQLPAWKLVLETLMSEGLLDAVFATSTVAAGVNFPARTVLFLNSDRFNGTEFVPLDPTELHQMTGRAGRRGMDRIGFAVILPGRFMDVPLMAKLSQSPPSDVFSRIQINFSMVLNLLLSHSPEQIGDLLQKSFAAFVLKSASKRKRVRAFARAGQGGLWHDFQRHLTFLKKHQYVTTDDRLTEDGLWASQLRVDQPLLIAEGFRRGVFPDTEPALMAAMMAAFVQEKEMQGPLIGPLLTKALLSSFMKVKRGLQSFAQQMRTDGFEVRAIQIQPAAAVYAWAGGERWEKVLKASGLAEGDLAQLVLRTADQLRHIRGLGHVFPDTSQSAAQAVDLILHDPVITYLS